MKRCILLIGVLLLVAASASAQTSTEATLSWDVLFFAQGVDPQTGSPTVTQNFLKSTSTCNLAPAPPQLVVVNPSKIVLADPDNPGRECALGPNSSGVLTSLPIGTGYRAAAIAKGPTLASQRSALSSPFDRAVIVLPPPVPDAPKIIR